MSEDLSPCIAIQIIIYQYEMDSVEDYYIELAYLISYGKEDSVEVFKLAEKYSNNATPVKVRAFL